MTIKNMDKRKIKLILIILGLVIGTYVLSVVFGISDSVGKCIEQTTNITS